MKQHGASDVLIDGEVIIQSTAEAGADVASLVEYDPEDRGRRLPGA